MTFIEKLGGRKYVLSIATIILCFVLVLAGKIDPDVFMKFVFGIMSVYAGTNVLNKMTAKAKPPVKVPNEAHE